MGTINRIGDFFDRSGSYVRRVFEYVGPTAYATGGDSFTPESLAMGKIEAVLGLTISNGTNILFGFYNRSTKKVLWYSATGTEATNGTDYSAYKGLFEVIGK